VKIAAARKWLDAHKDWLLILDNVDNAQAAAAENLVASLTGGHVLITGRTSDFFGVDRDFSARCAQRRRCGGIAARKRCKARDGIR
jgi:hypothetical protein